MYHRGQRCSVWAVLYVLNEDGCMCFENKVIKNLSSSALFAYTNENLVFSGDFNCVVNAMDKKDSKNAAVTEFESTIRVHSLVDACGRIVNLHNIGFTWSNPSMKIQSRSYYFFHPKSFAKVNSRMQNHAQHLLRSFCFNSHHLF